MPAYLVGINPPVDVERKVLELKKKVIGACGHAQQVDEPPHMTFVVNDFSDFDSIDNALRNIAGRHKPFEVILRSLEHFPPEKSGSYILHLPAKPSPEMSNLQHDVIDATSKFRRGSMLAGWLKKHAANYNFDEEEKANIERYGYPYVDVNFFPHVTVAILSKDEYSKVSHMFE